MIRRATLDDVPRIVDLGRLHYTGAGFSQEYDETAAARFAEDVIQRGVAFISSAGSIGGVIAPVYCAPSRWMAVEMWWHAFDGHGGALRDAFEAWAREVGADEVRLSAVWADRGAAVERVLQRAGYRRVETSYAKGLN